MARSTGSPTSSGASSSSSRSWARWRRQSYSRIECLDATPGRPDVRYRAEISEKQARSIKYQLSIAKLPLAKDVDDFAFAGTPINENLVRDLAGGAFIAQQRNVVLVGGSRSEGRGRGKRPRLEMIHWDSAVLAADSARTAGDKLAYR
jgi:hypothetical protein